MSGGTGSGAPVQHPAIDAGLLSARTLTAINSHSSLSDGVACHHIGETGALLNQSEL